MRRGQISADVVRETDSYIEMCSVPKWKLIPFIIWITLLRNVYNFFISFLNRLELYTGDIEVVAGFEFFSAFWSTLCILSHHSLCSSVLRGQSAITLDSSVVPRPTSSAVILKWPLEIFLSSCSPVSSHNLLSCRTLLLFSVWLSTSFRDCEFWEAGIPVFWIIIETYSVFLHI